MEKQVTLTLEMAQQMYASNIPLLKTTALSNFTEEELNTKKLPKTWGMLPKIVGFYVSNDSVCKYSDSTTIDQNKNTFALKEQAVASIAMAQLSQLMHVYNEGWIPEWNNKVNKFTIAFINDEIECDFYQTKRHFLAFKSKELRDEFLANFKDLIHVAKPLL
jgi:hypothetical protein